tara:strand:+ start:108 stop:368 length:261 start_codon:yes stop_codon:yes gene_type:complete
MQYGEVVDIQINTPEIVGLSPSNLKIVVVHDDGTNEEALLDVDEGEGTFTRPWKARSTGFFHIKLLSQGSDGTVKEWDSIGPFEVR